MVGESSVATVTFPPVPEGLCVFAGSRSSIFTFLIGSISSSQIAHEFYILPVP